jgi:hypothetical protein
MATTPNIRIPNCDDGLNTCSFELVEIRCVICHMSSSCSGSSITSIYIYV